MENNSVAQQANTTQKGFITPEAVLIHWQGHRKLTRQIIEAFPEDKLFTYSIGGMRPFAAMVTEIMDIADAGIQDLFKDEPTPLSEMDHHAGKRFAGSKEEMLTAWDKLTDKINALWPLIPVERFYAVMKAFGLYEGITFDIILYWIDNEIHHRSQAYVYLRSLGIEPPAFWDRH
jgi:uncharacterized damage-inducible protein DinB